MTEWNDTDTSAFTDPQWSRLPPPAFPESGTILLPIILGMIGVALAGFTLWLASHFTYVLILYGTGVGMVIGGTMAIGIERAKYTRGSPIFVVNVVFAVGAYLLYYWLVYLESTLGATTPVPGFLEFLVFRARSEPGWWFFPGIFIFVFWTLVELGVAIFVANRWITRSMVKVDTPSVPQPVLDFLVKAMHDDSDNRTLRLELHKRGWFRHEDQEKAIRAAWPLVTEIRDDDEMEEAEE